MGEKNLKIKCYRFNVILVFHCHAKMAEKQLRLLILVNHFTLKMRDKPTDSSNGSSHKVYIYLKSILV